MAMHGSYDAHSTYFNKGEEGNQLFARQEYTQKPIRANQVLSVRITNKIASSHVIQIYGKYNKRERGDTNNHSQGNRDS
jgi:hypothetical protein